MPKPPRLCSCGAIVPADSLCTCQREAIRARGRRHDANRPNSRQRGYTRAWEALRAEFLRLHPTCAFCGAGSQVVDHIQRHHGNPALVMSWNNLQALCKPCHDREKQRQERAASV
ncbi:HNH endonuclease [Fuscibacter oryzae]|uniref:HNH endonuclease n=1 Tax=Fuscibacter oryzae TaxID=2803939 RepID=A0A8J7MT97_9RHOB|nr:HNH endonuclease signature motif containing protein [Fuscibacter oryzae]MBL4927998.1 HNH endonuclease [Fuscibacter oryzae]